MKRRAQDILFPERYFRTNSGWLPAIPAYFFHQTVAEEFDRLCRQIIRGNFSALTVTHLLNGVTPNSRSLLLTFDDGWSSVWSVAFPLVRRYGLRFTLFVVPQAIEDSAECRPTLDDGADPASLVARDLSPRGMLTWGEVQAMHQSGLIDIQSHSLHHGVVFKTDRLDNFSRPAGPFPLPGRVPLVQRLEGKDVARWQLEAGTPLYPWGPALAVPRRFIENPHLRQRCLSIVKANGGADFFTRPDWQASLHTAVDHVEPGAWESDEARRDRVRQDLSTSKQLIEAQLPGLTVRVLAPPWAAMHPDLPAIARETGHELVMLGYPFEPMVEPSPIPLYPRLKGDAVWTLLQGPIIGLVAWWQTRRRNATRQRAGAIP